METKVATLKKAEKELQECKYLVKAALDGDLMAGVKLITEKYRKYLRKVAFSYNRQNDFDDLMQELFIYLYENDYKILRNWSQEKSFSAWLTTIFKNNLIYRGMKKMKKMPQVSIDNENEYLLEQIDSETMENHSYSSKQEVYFAMTNFSPIDEMIFSLKLDKIPSKDIAEQLKEMGCDLTPMQIDKKYQTLKKQLRRKFEEEDNKVRHCAA